jgi:hypothetical protein
LSRGEAAIGVDGWRIADLEQADTGSVGSLRDRRGDADQVGFKLGGPEGIVKTVKKFEQAGAVLSLEDQQATHGPVGVHRGQAVRREDLPC